MVKKSARRTRSTHTPAFKAKVALAALRDGRAVQPGMGIRHHLYPNGPRARLPRGYCRCGQSAGADTQMTIILEACHAVEIIAEAFAQFRPPEIVNIDPGSPISARPATSPMHYQIYQIYY